MRANKNTRTPQTCFSCYRFESSWLQVPFSAESLATFKFLPILYPFDPFFRFSSHHWPLIPLYWLLTKKTLCRRSPQLLMTVDKESAIPVMDRRGRGFTKCPNFSPGAHCYYMLRVMRLRLPRIYHRSVVPFNLKFGWSIKSRERAWIVELTFQQRIVGD